MEAVAEDFVVCEIGCRCSDADHRNPVDCEHDDGEDRKSEPSVCDNAVDLVRCGCAGGLPSLVTGLDHTGNVDVALVGDDALRIVVKFLFRIPDVILDMGKGLGRDCQLLHDLAVTFEDLDGIPSLLLLGKVVDYSLLDVGKRMLHRTGESMLRYCLCVLRSLDGSLGRSHHSCSLKSRDLNYLATELS